MTERETRYFERVGAAKTPVALAAVSAAGSERSVTGSCSAMVRPRVAGELAAWSPAGPTARGSRSRSSTVAPPSAAFPTRTCSSCSLAHPAFPGRDDGLARGYYRVSGQEEGIDFSYSGYSDWREWLCRTFLKVSPEQVWDNPETFADAPFVELVNFADNEGFIGPKTCAKLAADFAAHTPGHHAFGLRDHARAYERLAQMFRIAGGGGAVKFH